MNKKKLDVPDLSKPLSTDGGPGIAVAWDPFFITVVVGNRIARLSQAEAQAMAGKLMGAVGAQREWTENATRLASTLKRRRRVGKQAKKR